MLMRNLYARCGVITLPLALLGCTFFRTSPPASPTVPSAAAPQLVHFDDIVELRTDTDPIEHEDSGFNNCRSNSPLSGKHTVSRQLSYTTSWEFGGKAGVGGEVGISPVAKVNVDAELSSKYGTGAVQSITVSDEYTIDVPPRGQRYYVFRWQKTQHVGYGKIADNQINYRYPMELRLVGTDSYDTPCEPEPVMAPLSPAGTATPQAATSTARPTITPTSIAGDTVNRFVKTWTNDDSNTGGITRINITRAGGNVLGFHTFGKCQPTDCDWGVVQVTYQGSPAIVPYQFSFKVTTLTVALQGERLVVTEADHYTDSSGRSDRQDTYQFH